VIDLSKNISDDLEFEELQEIIDQQISKLPSRCQQIFLLSRYEHKSNKEIATELGISIQAVKNQISKAINFIRENLQSEEILYYFLIIGIRFL
ncbi:MAG: sigma-70 family RNA polymerase sigma factor, partial [Maribacter stanieri]